MSRIKRSSGGSRGWKPSLVAGGVCTALVSLLAVCIAGVSNTAAEDVASQEPGSVTESVKVDSSAPPAASATESGCESAAADSGTAAADAAAADIRAEAAAIGANSGTAPAAAGGMRVYIDPDSGEFTAPPPGVEIPQIEKQKRAAKRSVEVVPSPVPGGGVMINTQGRFLHSMKAKTGESGMEVKCQQDGSPKGAASTAATRENEKE